MMFKDNSVELHIVRTDDIDETARSQCIASLDEVEYDRYLRFVFDHDRRTFAIAHALLRCVLGSRAALPPRACRFAPGPSGRPIAVIPAAQRCSFNLSHTRGIAAVAVCEAPFIVGIDAEEIDEAWPTPTAATAFCSDRELALLRSISDPGRFAREFYRLWTLKESYLKATGVGIGDYLRRVECQLWPPAIAPLPELSGSLRVSCWQSEGPGPSILAISLLGPQRSAMMPVIRNWSSDDFVAALRGDRPAAEAADEELKGRELPSASSSVAIWGDVGRPGPVDTARRGTAP